MDFHFKFDRNRAPLYAPLGPFAIGEDRVFAWGELRVEVCGFDEGVGGRAGIYKDRRGKGRGVLIWWPERIGDDSA